MTLFYFFLLEIHEISIFGSIAFLVIQVVMLHTLRTGRFFFGRVLALKIHPVRDIGPIHSGHWGKIMFHIKYNSRQNIIDNWQYIYKIGVGVGVQHQNKVWKFYFKKENFRIHNFDRNFGFAFWFVSFWKGLGTFFCTLGPLALKFLPMHIFSIWNRTLVCLNGITINQL